MASADKWPRGRPSITEGIRYVPLTTNFKPPQSLPVPPASPVHHLGNHCSRCNKPAVVQPLSETSILHFAGFWVTAYSKFATTRLFKCSTGENIGQRIAGWFLYVAVAAATSFVVFHACKPTLKSMKTYMQKSNKILHRWNATWRNLAGTAEFVVGD